MLNWFLILILGFCIGAVVISLGGGGAAIYLGILTSVFHLPAAVAATTSLLTAFPSLVTGAFSQYRTGHINFKIGNQMMIAAVPATIVGSLVAPAIPKAFYTWLIAIILMLLGLDIFVRMLKPNSKTTTAAPKNQRLEASLYGILSGLMVGMVGIAGMSGGALILAGLLLMNLDMIHAAATSAYVLVGTTFVGLFFHLTNSQVDWHIGSALMIGAILGSLCAPYAAKYFKSPKVQRGIQMGAGVVLFIMGITMVI
ncbi:hypothetical protein IV38_GL001053 [Lactobacillus selangorensis]|uniref:Probable membrane transporter protein n=1 Tax=Lactobacillus selangorensis TaxID=81857 RepID=A0A0R2FKR4_9LACO|nr:sulfite exporter TauE/SafE family protein [Lactobacillus selangorensis]KRN28846.1 hypothetical protein IV38_GL001053 [Lactobacillus selangorensis]KRN32744.1 hypothetical protein IV40_GL000800 [Lactobacillus selangorensis]